MEENRIDATDALLGLGCWHIGALEHHLSALEHLIGPHLASPALALPRE